MIQIYELTASVLWWTSTAGVLLVTFVMLLYWWHSTLPVAKCVATMRYIGSYPLVTYWNFLMMIYKHKHPRVMILQMMAAVCKLYDKERITYTWLGFRPLIFFYKPETIEVLLNNSENISKSAEYGFLGSWLGTGLFTSTGHKWRSHRKLLTPAFHFHILETFLSSFNEQASILTKKMESEVGKPWIDIVPLITMCTLDTICETAMGVHMNAQSGEGKEYVQGINGVSDVLFYRIMRPWLWIEPIFLYCFPSGWEHRKNISILHNFTKKVIKEKKEKMINQNVQQKPEESNEGKRKKKPLLELLLEFHLKDESFTEENVREEVDTFMLAGHETTAMSVSWTLYELGRYPDVLEKVFQELDKIFGYDKEQEITSEDLRQLKYLECVIKEGLRLYPPGAFFARQLSENLKVKDFTLAPGCTCFVCVFAIHKDPEIFPRPEIFDPDRFLPENCSKRHPYAYIPFSAGPRNCIGQKFALLEIKTILAHILRKFKITSLDPRDKIETVAGIILKSTEPIRIKLDLRDF